MSEETAPRVLVIADHKVQTAGAWKDVPTDGVPHSYLSALERSGLLPVLVPALRSWLPELETILTMVDGVFLPGGRDIDARLYGQRPHDENDPPYPLRDELEIAMVRIAHRDNLPVFGDCRGMQVMNVAQGGTLIQHLGDHTDLSHHRGEVGTFIDHEVDLSPDSLLRVIVGSDRLAVRTHHHQAVNALGAGLVPTSVTDDGIVESVEDPSRDFFLGVQWHPEENWDGEGAPLFQAFANAVMARRDRRLLESSPH